MAAEQGRTQDAQGAKGPATRSAAVEPFVRGSAWPSGAGVSYPRANPDLVDMSRLPMDTWGSASLPVGVRLEFTGSATAIDISYRTLTDNLGLRGAGGGKFFSLWIGNRLIEEAPAALGEGKVRLNIGKGADAKTRRIVYLPEAMKPEVLSLTAVDGDIAPAARQPRWIAYGDSITEGWIASGPAGGWPAIAGRLFELDVVNMGYAGASRGEIVSAEHIAAIKADVISLAHGTNCWVRIPHSAEQMRANLRAFLDIVRQGHPDTPIVVVSPVTRPDAEAKANRLGATLADLRGAIEAVTSERIAAGDKRLALIRGLPLLRGDQLPDTIHPGDEGHQIMAQAIGKAVRESLGR